MPYLDADPADLQRVHGLADADLPDAAILNGVWALESKLNEFCAQFSGAREVMERTALMEVDGRRHAVDRPAFRRSGRRCPGAD